MQDVGLTVIAESRFLLPFRDSFGELPRWWRIRPHDGMYVAISKPEPSHAAPAQAKAWLKRAVAEGKVRNVGKPVRYVAISDSMPLFTEKSKA